MQMDMPFVLCITIQNWRLAKANLACVHVNTLNINDTVQGHLKRIWVELDMSASISILFVLTNFIKDDRLYKIQ